MPFAKRTATSPRRSASRNFPPANSIAACANFATAWSASSLRRGPGCNRSDLPGRTGHLLPTATIEAGGTFPPGTCSCGSDPDDLLGKLRAPIATIEVERNVGLARRPSLPPTSMVHNGCKPIAAERERFARCLPVPTAPTLPLFAIPVDENGFVDWLIDAKPGDTLVYYRGHLSHDRMPSTQGPRRYSQRRKLADVANRVLAAESQGLVMPVQRRVGQQRVALSRHPHARALAHHPQPQALGFFRTEPRTML